MTTIQIFLVVVSLSGIMAQVNFYLYSKPDCKDFALRVFAKDYANLADVGFDNKLVSIKLEGDWILYDLPNFNAEADAPVDHVSSPVYSVCRNLDKTAGVASSIRSVVTIENKTPLQTFTLYAKSNFQGQTESTSTGIRLSYELPAHKSLSFDGIMPWTIYKNINYGGPSLCIYPEGKHGDPTFIPDLMQYTTPIPYDFIKSAHIGCDV